MADAAAEQREAMLVQLTAAELDKRIEAAVSRAVERVLQSAANHQQQEYLTTKQAAQLLKISTRSLQNWVAQGLPHDRAGNSLRFKQAELLDWSSKRKKQRR